MQDLRMCMSSSAGEVRELDIHTFMLCSWRGGDKRVIRRAVLSGLYSFPRSIQILTTGSFLA